MEKYVDVDCDGGRADDAIGHKSASQQKQNLAMMTRRKRAGDEEK